MKEYRYSDLVAFLKKKHIGPEEAIDICKRATEINPTNHRTLWKMQRFQMYLWQRMEEDKKGLLGKKIESVRRVVSSKNYTSHYDKNHKGIMGLKKFDYEYEVFKLNKLITDPRQYHYFKSEYFTYPPPRDNKKIPQEIINKYVPKPSEKR